VRSPVFSESKPAGAAARCRDGSYSFNTLGAKLGFGDIKIVAESSDVQEWRKVRYVRTVYKALLRASKGLPIEHGHN